MRGRFRCGTLSSPLSKPLSNQFVHPDKATKPCPIQRPVVGASRANGRSRTSGIRSSTNVSNHDGSMMRLRCHLHKTPSAVRPYNSSCQSPPPNWQLVTGNLQSAIEGSMTDCRLPIADKRPIQRRRHGDPGSVCGKVRCPSGRFVGEDDLPLPRGRGLG